VSPVGWGEPREGVRVTNLLFTYGASVDLSRSGVTGCDHLLAEYAAGNHTMCVSATLRTTICPDSSTVSPSLGERRSGYSRTMCGAVTPRVAPRKSMMSGALVMMVSMSRLGWRVTMTAASVALRASLSGWLVRLCSGSWGT
jgi:hypothetical protein